MANKSKAKDFVKKWMGRGDEKQDTSRFWIELLQEVYGDSEVHNDTHLLFEVPTGKSNKKGKEFKDVVINRRSKNATLIEQKSFDVDLDHKLKQSDGSLLTPFEQAQKYDNNSTRDDKARWIITSNFQEFRIYDMQKEGFQKSEPKIIRLEELPSKIEWLDFLLPNYSEENPQFVEETAVSVKAGELVGKMYDALLARYAEPESEHTQKELNKLCVRLVFCLYADDAGLFDKNDTNKFENYIRNTDTKYVRQTLINLFKVLDQKEGERDKYLDNTLKSFPYVNGGLFKGDVEIPNFDDDLKKLLVESESASFDWSVVSPTIFGAVFESTLNAETRRNGGMHYTSIENIHKVIDPLFLDELKKELNDALSDNVSSKKEKALLEFQKKISNLTFLDPACGSGNFLTETYLSLRRLENEVIRQLQGIKVALYFEDNSVIKVSIQQFYGIEINDFAVSVAKTALWIAESQAFKETESILSTNREYFPLKSYNNILEGNALTLDWEEIIAKNKLNYIMGNPPFSGARVMSPTQKQDIVSIFGKKWKGVGDLDYVSGWFKKSFDYIKNTKINAALVSTNSIVQGSSVINLWSKLFDEGIDISFAYQSFQWDSETSGKAHVYCVIVGFCSKNDSNNKEKIIYSEEKKEYVRNINGYLLNGDNIFIRKRMKPLCLDAPEMFLGGQPIDDGNLVLTENEKNVLIKKDPSLIKYIRPYMMGQDFLNRKPRYCLWLVGVDPKTIKNNNLLMEITSKVQSFRIQKDRKNTKKAAEQPSIFAEPKECFLNYVAIPKVSSSARKYLPIDYLDKSIIPGDKLFVIEDSSIYSFGILNSNVHNAWLKTVTGRLGIGYSYSNTIVYNNFVWPTPTKEQKEKIQKTAQEILDARLLYPEDSLADLYDQKSMPIELLKAHKDNDNAVMEAYGFCKDMSEQEIVSKLFELYKKAIKE